jgi:hypothetical protein
VPSTHQESSFESLNRIAGDYWEHPRALMQEWLDRMPSEQEYNDLRQRFRSRDDEQFRSAFLELYLHESLIRAGYTVTIHPEVQGTSRRPDFLAERDDLRFFMEAIAPGSTPAEKAARSAEPYCSTRWIGWVTPTSCCDWTPCLQPTRSRASSSSTASLAHEVVGDLPLTELVRANVAAFTRD